MDGLERLQKVLAQAGVASRRQAEEMILAGRVEVNGSKVTALGTKVSPVDRITVDGRPLNQAEPLHYYLLNKPAGVITSAKDPQGRKTVLDLMRNVRVRVYPVGRLDYDTSGLLVMTNDGELAHRLTHPSFGIEKTYRVWVRGGMPEQALQRLRAGVVLEDGKTAPAVVERVGGLSKEGMEVTEITIHEGRNRQVRRMYEAVGFLVSRLERVRFGPLFIDKTPRPGEYRALTQREIRELRAAAGLKKVNGPGK